MRADGSDPVRLSKGAIQLPEVSPDGQNVLFVDGLAAMIRVARLRDGAVVPFDIAIVRRTNTTAILGVTGRRTVDRHPGSATPRTAGTCLQSNRDRERSSRAHPGARSPRAAEPPEATSSRTSATSRQSDSSSVTAAA
jgi:hypothetical protein